MRITKSIAEYVAKQMVSEKKKLLERKRDIVKGICTEIYKREIPKDVLKLWDKNSSWLKSTSSVRLNGYGFSYEYQDIEELPKNFNRDPFLIFENNEAELVLSARNEIQKINDEIRSLQSEIEQALLSLVTYKRVSENFPEAIPFLPKIQNTSLVVDLSNLRNKIK